MTVGHSIPNDTLIAMQPKQPFCAAICCFLFGKETDREKKEQALVFPHAYTQDLHPQPEKGNVQYMPTLVCVEKI